jgi:hypothetical protein
MHEAINRDRIDVTIKLGFCYRQKLLCGIILIGNATKITGLSNSFLK